jgi:hypothetical protein
MALHSTAVYGMTVSLPKNVVFELGQLSKISAAGDGGAAILF